MKFGVLIPKGTMVNILDDHFIETFNYYPNKKITKRSETIFGYLSDNLEFSWKDEAGIWCYIDYRSLFLIDPLGGIHEK